MSAIIAALLAAFGPLVADFLLKWLQSLFTKAAKNLPKNAKASDLVMEAIDLTPRTRPIRRALLRRMLDHADEVAAGQPLTAADRKELRGLAAVAE